MKIYVTSDIHLEFGDCLIKNEDNVDVLILGGDIMIAQDLHDHPETSYSNDNLADLGRRQQTAQRFRDFIKRVSFQFPHVIYIAGNHEFYNGKWPIGVQYLRDECAKYPNVYFMENDCQKINDVTFVGSTLWTDMNREDPHTLYAIRNYMNDFRCITNSTRETNFRDTDGNFHTRVARFTPDDTVEEHKAMLAFVNTAIAARPDRQYVVVGHHSPSKLSTKPQYEDDQMVNGAYSSDLSEFILDHPQIRLWTHGHTHHEFDYLVGTTRIVCNPRGYVGHEQQASDWRLMTVEV